MKVLVVEDDRAKARAVVDLLGEELRVVSSQDIVIADSLSSAVRIAARENFAFIVLDLLIPYISGGETGSRAGIELLRELRKTGGRNRYATVVGLSAFPEEVEESRPEFESLGVMLIRYDSSGDWKRGLGESAVVAREGSGGNVGLDFLVFVALDEERAGMDSAGFVFGGRSIAGGLNSEFCTIAGSPILRGAVVRLRQMGVVAATLDVAAALSIFHVQVVCMSGICAGFSGQVALGQIVVASPAWEYQCGKWSENGFEIAPTQVSLRPQTRVVIEQNFGDVTIVEEIEQNLQYSVRRPVQRAKPIIAPAATGSAVVADAARLKHILQQHRKLAALDMETFGLYYAVSESARYVPHFFSAKCVVDFADSAKNDGLHEYGCVVSARVFRKIIMALA